jgi:hypothetical protein
MVDPGYTIETGALAEMGQEVGFYGPIELHHAFVHSRPGFSYHSFVGLVLEEFSFLPEPDYAYETSFIGWFDHSTIVRMVLEQPETFHPGFLEMWAASQDVIKTVIEAQVQ